MRGLRLSLCEKPRALTIVCVDVFRLTSGFASGRVRNSTKIHSTPIPKHKTIYSFLNRL